MDSWHIEVKDCTPEQRAIVERVYGLEFRGCLKSDLGHTWSSDYCAGEKITPDEAFKRLGLDKLLEPKYTPEQLEAVKAFAGWIKDIQFENGELFDMWLKEQDQ